MSCALKTLAVGELNLVAQDSACLGDVAGGSESWPNLEQRSRVTARDMLDDFSRA